MAGESVSHLGAHLLAATTGRRSSHSHVVIGIPYTCNIEGLMHACLNKGAYYRQVLAISYGLRYWTYILFFPLWSAEQCLNRRLWRQHGQYETPGQRV